MPKTQSPFSTEIYIKNQERYIGDSKELTPNKRSGLLNMLVLFTDDVLGDKSSSLSSSLKISLIKALAEKEPYPSVMVFMNKGVFLTLEDAPCLKTLRDLEAKGVLILSNCTCLDYYKVMDKLSVGGITNMYHIAELIKIAKNTVTF